MRQALATALTLAALTTMPWLVAPPADAADPVPTTVSVSAPSFRPAPDGVQDTVTISVADPTATSVTLSVDPGVATWTLVPDATTHQVSQVWDGKGNGGTDGLAAPGSHTITAVAHTPTGDVTAQTTVTVLIDTISATRDFAFTAKAGLVKSLNGRCGKLQMPSAHHWAGSIGFNADAKCDAGRKNYAEGVFAVIPLGTFAGHPVHDYTTVQVSVYGGGAPKAYRRSGALLVFRNPAGGFLPPTKLSAHVGWQTGRTLPASDVMYTDHSFGWDVVSLQHSHYDIQGFKVTFGYTYLY